VGDGDFFATYLHGVGGLDLGAGLGDELAVDGDFALLDQLGGVAAGADAGVGDVFVEGELFGGAWASL